MTDRTWQVGPLDRVDATCDVHVSDSFKKRRPMHASIGIMQPQIARYFDTASRFSAVVDGATDWSSPSPCAGWTGADVLDHIVDTQRDFFAQRGRGLGLRPAGEPAIRCYKHLDGVRGVVADDDLVTAEYDGYFGRTTLADTLADFYGFDVIAHRWDLGRATSQPVSFSPDEMDALEKAIAGFGDALYSEGICARPVDVPADTSRQDGILVTLGRRA